MLIDAMLHLCNNGFNILALVMKNAELVMLNNMIVFVVDDFSIFSSLHTYITNVGFHFVSNHQPSIMDLEKLPIRTALLMLERGHSLLITTFRGETLALIRINYIRVKVADFVPSEANLFSFVLAILFNLYFDDFDFKGGFCERHLGFLILSPNIVWI